MKKYFNTSLTLWFSNLRHMAFSGKGGAWRQKDKTINNPYWGARMLRCGMVTMTGSPPFAPPF